MNEVFLKRMDHYRDLFTASAGIPTSIDGHAQGKDKHDANGNTATDSAALYKYLERFFKAGTTKIAGERQYGGVFAYSSTGGMTLQLGSMDMPPEMTGENPAEDDEAYTEADDAMRPAWDVIILTAEPVRPEYGTDDGYGDDNEVLFTDSSNGFGGDEDDDDNFGGNGDFGDDEDDDDFDDDGWFYDDGDTVLILGFSPEDNRVVIFLGTQDEDGEFVGSNEHFTIDPSDSPRESAALLLRSLIEDEDFYPFNIVLGNIRDHVLSVPRPCTKLETLQRYLK